MLLAGDVTEEFTAEHDEYDGGHGQTVGRVPPRSHERGVRARRESRAAGVCPLVEIIKMIVYRIMNYINFKFSWVLLL